MKMARSEFLVSLDDDSCFTDRTDLAVAVKRMEAEPEIGVLTFLVYQGAKLAYPIQTPRLNEKYTCDFVGCAHMIRASVTTEVGVYRDFYYYYGEESEYSLRIWNAGWRILFFPKVIVHHRVSSAGRSNRKILRYSIRNNIWTTILHMPWPRVGIQLLWRFTNYGFESLRLLQPVAFVGAIASCVSGMPRVLRLRKPISGKTLELLDLISTKEVRTPAELSSKGPSLKDRITVFYASWKDRPRQRSFWDRRSGDLGKASTIVFEHQLDQEDRPLEGK